MPKSKSKSKPKQLYRCKGLVETNYEGKTVETAQGEQVAYDIRVVASNATIDRHKEVVLQNWELENFADNPVMLVGHKHSHADGSPPSVGNWVHAEVAAGPDGKEALWAYGAFGETKLGKEYKLAYAPGEGKTISMRAVSVGFDSLEREKRVAPDGVQRWHHDKNDLWEISLVAVGANPDALTRGAGEQEPPELMDALEEAKAERDEIKTKLDTIEANQTELKTLLESLQREPAPGDEDEDEELAEEGLADLPIVELNLQDQGNLTKAASALLAAAK